MCLYPKLIKNKKYTKTKKNGGIVPAVLDERTLWVPVGCGNCLECRKQKARQWQSRLLEEIKTNKNAKFVTLTFSDQSIAELTENETLEGYALDNKIATIATRRSLERWRKKNKKSVRHWLVTELGHNGTENIHLHGLIWSDNTIEIEEIWKYGYVWIGKYVNEKTINYIIKYVTKQDEKHKHYKSKILTSAGIGNNYVNNNIIADWHNNKYKEKNTIETYRTRNGNKTALPIYWRNKIYSEEEREKLWIEKLDKNERWILGQKIDISNGDERYKKVLKQAQIKNKRLGDRKSVV